MTKMQKATLALSALTSIVTATAKPLSAEGPVCTGWYFIYFLDTCENVSPYALCQLAKPDCFIRTAMCYGGPDWFEVACDLDDWAP